MKRNADGSLKKIGSLPKKDDWLRGKARDWLRDKIKKGESPT